MSLYTIKIFKSWGARDPERRWSNTYEVESTSLTPWGLNQAVADFVEAERTIHATSVNFLSATISTWEEDGTPYNPLSFYTMELSETGVRGTEPSNEALDSNVCYVLKFSPLGGRSGRRFYRGCLFEADVLTGGDLKATLVAGSPLDTDGTQFTAFMSVMDAYISTGGVGDTLVLATRTVGPSVEREVESISVGGVTINKRNHRYFDRA